MGASSCGANLEIPPWALLMSNRDRSARSGTLHGGQFDWGGLGSTEAGKPESHAGVPQAPSTKADCYKRRRTTSTGRLMRSRPPILRP